MNTHPYIRAYLAGIAVPTLFLLVIMMVFLVARHVYNFPVPVERIIVFPMAVVPNVWGLWNMLFIRMHGRRYLSPGLHGALLPFLLAPAGFLITRALDFTIPSFVRSAFPLMFPVGVVIYYLVWKHLVQFLNDLLGIA